MIDYSNKKIMIFSDSHLKCEFNNKWFDEIAPIIKESDIVIINGDFWEGLLCNLSDIVKSEWRMKLFPLLKNKTIFLHGNHDESIFIKNIEDLKLFSFESGHEFEFKSGNKIFHIRHGHILAKKYSNWVTKIMYFLRKKWNFVYHYIKNNENKFEFFLNKIGRGVIKKKYKTFVKNQNDNKIYIFGHVHLKKHNLENNFLVLGDFKDGKKRYIEILNGEIKFYDERYW